MFVLRPFWLIYLWLMCGYGAQGAVRALPREHRKLPLLRGPGSELLAAHKMLWPFQV